jgi:hypothetical protein
MLDTGLVHSLYESACQSDEARKGDHHHRIRHVHHDLMVSLSHSAILPTAAWSISHLKML